MLAKQLIITVSCIIVCNGLSIGTVSVKQNVKREANVGDLFPDWVPFKNKHGEELGEFVQVTKAKPKKRLAPPVNFVMRAVAEPEGDEYFEKAGADNEDYFEKKEWSDQNRPAQPEAETKANHTQISEIDGVVNIITKKPNNPVVEALKKAKQQAQKNAEITSESSEEVKKTDEKVIEKKVNTEDTKAAESKKQEKKYEEEADYEEGSSEKKQDSAETEQSENEAKKASILDSVDELKERHAEEQRFISEKVKEEEIYKEERERDKIQAQLSQEEHEKNLPKFKKTAPDYEEYEEKALSIEDKYKINPERKKETATPARIPKRTSKRKGKKDKAVESGKLSVFKNPQLYMVYDDDSNEQSTTPKPIKIRGPKAKKRLKNDKFSSKYSATTANSDESERISLVPQEDDAKAGEPTLFFPKKRKNKKRKNKYATLPADSSVAETIAEKAAKQVAAIVDPSVAGSVVTAAGAVATVDVLSTNSDAVSDAVPAPSDKKEEGKKEEDFNREKGGGRAYSSEHDEEHKELGKKAYEGVHEETKSAKGHHDKENHLGQYDDHGGTDKFHHDEAGHYGIHHHEEHGKKHAKYEESGKHSKGHSTKGSHDIHKKEEYEKKIEFFEEEGDSGEEEKHGGYNQEHGHSEGGHFKKGDFQAGHEEHAKGESGDFSKGGHMHVHKGHKSAAGDDGHGRHGHSHFEKEGQDSGKKWVYHHGHPAKTANLVMIDRRAEKYYHGPQYYG